MKSPGKILSCKFIGRIVSGWIVVCLIAGCSSGEDEIDAPPAQTPQIIVMYAPGGLGDQGYNDCILTGVQNFKKTYFGKVEIYQYSPGSLEQAERLVSDWLSLPGSDIPALFIVASNEYEQLLTSQLAEKSLTSNKRILFFESDNPARLPVTTFRMSMYGASYLAGVTAACCMENTGKDALVLLAHPADKVIATAEAGFRDGFTSVAPAVKVNTEYLADDLSGYISAPLAYQRMRMWAESYGFIYPVAGGSNQGIYRYTRENEESPFTAGMDIDQSGLSRKITGSMIKHIDMVVYNYMESWLKTGELPESATLGIESGYIDWMLSRSYSQYSTYVDAARDAAIKKEETEL